MLILLSPSKTLDFKTESPYKKEENLIFPKESSEIIKQLKKFSVLDLKKLMHISDNIALLNYQRFQKYNSVYKIKKNNKKEYNFKQAIFAFKGDVYKGFNFLEYKKKDFESLNKKIIILSGLYGILKPLTNIKPYRLEMGIKFNLFNDKFSKKNLYLFWKDKLTKEILKKINKQRKDRRFLLNLASQEYFKVLNKKEIKEYLVDTEFKISKNNKIKTIAIYAKRQRGCMANWIIKNNIEKIEDIKKYKNSGFIFSKKLSEDRKLIFIKKVV